MTFTQEAFWNLIDAARGAAGTDDQAFVLQVETTLVTLSDTDLVTYAAHMHAAFHTYHCNSQLKSHWLKALQHMPSQGFEYWCFWLIAQGSAMYTTIQTSQWEAVPYNHVSANANPEIASLSTFWWSYSDVWAFRHGSLSLIEDYPNFETILEDVGKSWGIV
jgi:hypothetical protein